MGLWGWIGSVLGTAIAVLVAWPVLPEKGLGRIVLIAVVGGLFITGNLLLKFHTGDDAFEHLAKMVGPPSCDYFPTTKCAPPPLEVTPPVPKTVVTRPPAPEPPAISPASKAYQYVNMHDYVFNLSMAKDENFTSYDWIALRIRIPGVAWVESLKMLERADQCNFQLKGQAEFSMLGIPDLSRDGMKPETWDISACGPRFMVRSVTATRFVGNEKVEDLKNGILKTVQRTGATIQSQGCNLDFGYREKIEFYKVSHSAKKDTLISTLSFCDPSGCRFEFGIYPGASLPNALKSSGRTPTVVQSC